MITVDQLPEKSVEATRLAMAIALANDGDGIPECIAAALNAWPGMDYQQGALVTANYRDPGKIILPLPTQEKENG